MMPYTVDGIDLPPVGPDSEPHPKIMYELSGVVVHMGVSTAGHYYSFCRIRDTPDMQATGPGRWFKFNDSEVWIRFECMLCDTSR